MASLHTEPLRSFYFNIFESSFSLREKVRRREKYHPTYNIKNLSPSKGEINSSF